MPSGTRLSLLSIELPRAITPELAGLTVGAVVGVVGFIAVLLLVGRGSRRGTARRVQMPADQVVFIPPYGTLQRDTPLPPAAFQIPVASQYAQPPQMHAPQHVHPNAHAHGHYGHGPALPFRPSTDLSARAFAKMGYDVGDDGDSPNSDPELFVECEMSEDDDVVPGKTHAPPSAPVSVSAILVVEESGGVRAADKSDPHPLGIIPTGSSAMQAAPPSAPRPAAGAPWQAPQPPQTLQPAPRAVSFADLEMDDGATEIGETYFDEPPQPRRRTDPPKIRAVAPAAPRFPASAQLPHPTPPPQRAVPSPRG